MKKVSKQRKYLNKERFLYLTSFLVLLLLGVLYIISYITDDELDDFCVVEKFPDELLPNLSEENYFLN